MITIELPWPHPALAPHQIRPWTEADDAELKKMFLEMSHAEIGLAIGRTRSAVRNRCSRIGLIKKPSVWSEYEYEALRAAYKNRGVVDVVALSEKIGRGIDAIYLKASRLGYGDQSRPRVLARKIKPPKFESVEALREFRSERQKQWLANNGHPRGSLGMKHTQETRDKQAELVKAWNSQITPERRISMTIKAMKTRTKNGTYAPERDKTKWKAAWREIGGVRKYYRSKWEANYAHYLQWLKEKGHIANWMHEPTTFWFEGVKRGTVSYLPDFLVIENDGSEAYHEVKGWMDERSKTKIKRMAKYHPKIKLIVIDGKGYAALKKSVQGLVPGWES